ncbi:dynein axonemal assembly factor 3 isoform X2 [Aquarana catesbeiana]|uniref:dynein axonemal assembly factor 3 isoform X2 n=1 Tax=Aquarana catesbeiana TaxID=8400 RepID=UPI003CC9271C
MASGGSGEVYPTLWGFSPALDLQMHCRQSTLQYLTTCDDIPELNILLVGCGDGRHLLKTVCQARRWPHRKLHFFIIESDLELLARQMLFLTLALETSEQMGLQEKCEMFLELFGNSLVRSKTATFLQEKCGMFIRCVTDPEYQQSVLPQLDMSSIKFKERDELEYIFKFWQSPEPKLFPIERYWDVKNRQYLGRRYDSRRGAYDWDLNMKLHDHGAVMINAMDYNRWRENGVAFTIREGNYDVPNKTLASQMSVTHTAQDLSKFNITAMFHELVTGQKYSPSVLSKDEAEDNSACNVSTSRETEATIQEEVTEEKNGSTDYFMKIDNIEIHFLPLSWVNELHRRSKFLNLFNLVFFSCSMVHYLNAEYKLITARKATLIVELTKFMVDLHLDKVKSYVTIVTKVAKEAGFTTTENIDWKRDYIATFERLEDYVEEKNGH